MSDLERRVIRDIRFGMPIQNPHDSNQMVIPLDLQVEHPESRDHEGVYLLLPWTDAEKVRKELSDRFAPALDTSLGKKILYNLVRIENTLRRIEENLGKD